MSVRLDNALNLSTSYDSIFVFPLRGELSFQKPAEVGSIKLTASNACKIARGAPSIERGILCKNIQLLPFPTKRQIDLHPAETKYCIRLVNPFIVFFYNTGGFPRDFT